MFPPNPVHGDVHRNLETGDRYKFFVSETVFEDEAQQLREASGWQKLPALVSYEMNSANMGGIYGVEYGSTTNVNVDLDLTNGNVFVVDLADTIPSMVDSWVHLDVVDGIANDQDSFKIILKNTDGRKLAFGFGGGGMFFTPDGASDSNGIQLPANGACILEFMKVNSNDWYGWYVGGIDGVMNRSIGYGIDMSNVALPA